MESDIFKNDPRNVKTETEEDEYTRKTFIVNSKYANLIDRQAFWERRQIKDVLNEIFKEYYKDKNIKQYPK